MKYVLTGLLKGKVFG